MASPPHLRNLRRASTVRRPVEQVALGRWQVPKLTYPCWAAPVLSNKRLYLRSEDRLVCIDAAKP